MHHGHPYAVQSAAFFVALIPFIALFTILIGARFFESVRRARKPAPVRPAMTGIAGLVPVRRFAPSAE